MEGRQYILLSFQLTVDCVSEEEEDDGEDDGDDDDDEADNA